MAGAPSSQSDLDTHEHEQLVVDVDQLSSLLRRAATNFRQEMRRVSDALDHLAGQEHLGRAHGMRKLAEALAFAAQGDMTSQIKDSAALELQEVLAGVSHEVYQAVNELRADLLKHLTYQIPEPTQSACLKVTVALPWGEKFEHTMESGTSYEELLGVVAAKLQIPRASIHQMRMEKSVDGTATATMPTDFQSLEHGDGDLELRAIFNVLPEAYIGSCTKWAQHPKIKLPDMFSQLGLRIRRTEMRGITLLQLEALADLARHVMNFVDITDISARPVLYKHLRSSHEAPDHGSNSSEASFDTGDDCERESNLVNLACKAAKSLTDKSDESVELNMYHLDNAFVKPLTTPFFCSLVELLATHEQAPRVFVSHYWGNPFWQLLRLLRLHARERHLQISDAVWICTFANNQHDLSELQGDLQSTPFYKVIRLQGCLGTVAILDSKTLPFTRIWCVLESFISTDGESKASGKFYDLAAWIQVGGQVCGDQEVPPQGILQLDLGDGTFADRAEDSDVSFAVFPTQVARRGFGIDLLSAKASRESDRRSILHFIAGTAEKAAAGDPPEEHPNYDALNFAVRNRVENCRCFGYVKTTLLQTLPGRDSWLVRPMTWRRMMPQRASGKCWLHHLQQRMLPLLMGELRCTLLPCLAHTPPSTCSCKREQT